MAATVVTQKDTTFTKIFVGGLPYHTTDQSLREFFEQFGDIEEAVVITDRQTGKSRGYGFVTMADRAAAERACKDPNPVIDGRKANVNLAYLGAKPRGIATAATLPFVGLKSYPGLLQSQYAGLPQYVYPSAYVAANPNVIPVAPHSPLSPSASGSYIDYTTAAAYAGQLPNGFEAYPATAAGYVTPAYTAAAYAAAAVPQPLAGHIAHYQTPQIQERMQ